MEETNGSSDEFTFIHQQAIHVQLDAAIMTGVIMTVSTTLFFTCVNSIMFYTLRSKPNLRETSRYILFANMLFNDSVNLMSSAVLYLFAVAYLHLVKAICALAVMMAVLSYTHSPLNLAVMSLERYVAICFPLWHSQIATKRRTYVAIGVVWFISSLNFIIDMLYMTLKDPDSFAKITFCTREQLYIVRWQVNLAEGFNSFYFIIVAVIIIYTYISITVAARSVSSDKDSARKANKTVLLHLIQLGLCLTSFLYGIFESLIATAGTTVFLHLQFFNFTIFIILPRCLSPLIYGLRDNALGPLFLNNFMCKINKVKAVVITHSRNQEIQVNLKT